MITTTLIAKIVLTEGVLIGFFQFLRLVGQEYKRPRLKIRSSIVSIVITCLLILTIATIPWLNRDSDKDALIEDLSIQNKRLRQENIAIKRSIEYKQITEDLESIIGAK